MNKIKMTLGIAFFAVAPLLGAIVVMLIVQWVNFSATAQQTSAIITDITTYHDNDGDVRHTVWVEYVVDGKVYERVLGSYTSNMREGQSVTVNYDPKDPDRIMQNPTLGCVMLSIFILSFGGVGGGMLFSELRRRSIVNRLAAEEKYIVLDSNCNCMEVPSNYSSNGVRYMQMDFLYYDPVSGQEYTFSSNPYHPLKSPFRFGQNVTVYVDLEKDPKKYYVSFDE